MNKALFAAAGIVAGLASVALTAPAAYAETITSATICANPFTGAQAGPSSFTFTVPTTIHPGDSVAVQLSFTVANSSGFPITDLNTFSMAGATPVALTAGSQGAVANGSSVTVTLSGTWSPAATGTQTIAASGWTFNTVAFGLTIPVTCSFSSTAPSITRTVTASPTLAVRPDRVEAGRRVDLSGANWAASTAGTVSLCTDAAGTANCAAIGTVRSSASGHLCGGVTVPAATAAGTYSIKVTIGADTKVAGIQVLKPPPPPGHGHGPGPAPGPGHPGH